MSSAFKCDRCGKFYILSDEGRPLIGTNCRPLMGIEFTGSGYIGYEYDLCSGCANDLYIFLKDSGKTKSIHEIEGIISEMEQRAEKKERDWEPYGDYENEYKVAVNEFIELLREENDDT